MLHRLNGHEFEQTLGPKSLPHPLNQQVRAVTQEQMARIKVPNLYPF